jgi:hypothetical protein
MRILTMLLEEIKAQNQTLILLVQQLLSRSLVGQELDMGPLPDGLRFPLSSMAEIDHLNVLVQDSDIKGKVVSISIFTPILLI